jgi:hypothetical protein
VFDLCVTSRSSQKKALPKVPELCQQKRVPLFSKSCGHDKKSGIFMDLVVHNKDRMSQDDPANSMEF